MKETEKRSKNLKIILGVAGLVLFVTLILMGANLVYHSGYEAGKNHQSDETHTALSDLGATIAEKTNTLSALNELNLIAPSEANSENIEEYLKKLDEVINSIKNPDIKSLLNDYKSSWTKFQEVYTKEDNSAIETELTSLRSAANDTALKITEIYNLAITSAAEKLPD